jgi:hypothetical protein
MLPFQVLMPELGLVIDAVGSSSTSVLSPLFISTFFASECLVTSPTLVYQKEERALPGEFIAVNLARFPLLNVMSRITHPLALLSLSRSS